MSFDRNSLAKLLARLTQEVPPSSIRMTAAVDPHPEDTAIGVLTAIQGDVSGAKDRILSKLDRVVSMTAQSNQ